MLPFFLKAPPMDSFTQQVLAARLSRANLVVVPGGGHSSMEPAMAQQVARAPDRLYDRIVSDGTWKPK